MMALAFALAYGGFTAICFAMPSHGRKLGVVPGRAIAAGLRSLGSAGLLASLYACALHWGWVDGSVAWFGVLSVAGLALIGTLAVNARLALLIAPVGLAAAAMLMLVPA